MSLCSRAHCLDSTSTSWSRIQGLKASQTYTLPFTGHGVTKDVQRALDGTGQ